MVRKMNNPLITSCKIAAKTELFSTVFTVVRGWPTTKATLSTECCASPIMDFMFMMHSQNHFNKTKGYQIIS